MNDSATLPVGKIVGWTDQMNHVQRVVTEEHWESILALRSGGITEQDHIPSAVLLHQISPAKSNAEAPGSPYEN
jgi:hypothetical protein